MAGGNFVASRFSLPSVPNQTTVLLRKFEFFQIRRLRKSQGTLNLGTQGGKANVTREWHPLAKTYHFSYILCFHVRLVVGVELESTTNNIRPNGRPVKLSTPVNRPQLLQGRTYGKSMLMSQGLLLVQPGVSKAPQWIAHKRDPHKLAMREKNARNSQYIALPTANLYSK
jgi:hypothetical protein